MDNTEFLKLCKQTIVNYHNEQADVIDGKLITPWNVYVVWSCKTLQNNKAMLSTDVGNGMYYELTYNGDKKELYVDVYKKWENRKLKLADEGTVLPYLHPAM